MKRIVLQNLTSCIPNKKSGIVLLVSAIICSITTFVQSQERSASDQAIERMVAKIQTDTNPEFVYDFEKTKFVPPAGKTLLIMGQSSERISEYLDHFPDQPLPGGWSAYWGIPEFVGVTESHKNEAGASQNHQMLLDKFPNSVVQSALWMVGTWDVAKKAGNGDYDKVVKKYAAWAKAAGRPIYLRIGYEFDGPHNQLQPDEYIKAYRHIVDLLRARGAHNIAFVWHSYAEKPFKDYQSSAWYPGDDYVDWVGISVFGRAYGDSGFGPYCDAILEFAQQHKKPVMIAESNPIYGITAESAEVWDQWFTNFFSFIYNKNIKAVSFINEDWPSTGIPGISEWKDGRLYNNTQVSKAWFRETNKDRYLKHSPALYEQLGYESGNK